jgi:hypothetical protein
MMASVHCEHAGDVTEFRDRKMGTEENGGIVEKTMHVFFVFSVDSGSPFSIHGLRIPPPPLITHM